MKKEIMEVAYAWVWNGSGLEEMGQSFEEKKIADRMKSTHKACIYPFYPFILLIFGWYFWHLLQKTYIRTS